MPGSGRRKGAKGKTTERPTLGRHLRFLASLCVLVSWQ